MPPKAQATRKANASVCISMTRFSNLRDGFGSVERRGKPLFFTIVSRTIPKARPPDSSRVVPADDMSVGVLADYVVKEKILSDDGVAFHAHHLGNVRDAARTVAQTSRLDDDVDRRADHFADGSRRQRKSTHRDHRFAARQGF